jgi:3-oxo-5-alpha-steroid 4-dehydrogenase 3 / polyprenol reductase
MFSIMLFVIASWVQYRVHKYLSQLPPSPNYVFPKAGPLDLFNSTLTPHYLCEVAIYFGIAGISLSWTVVSAAIFVAVNLGVSADVTRQWYELRFGREAVRGKARMIPWIW